MSLLIDAQPRSCSSLWRAASSTQLPALSPRQDLLESFNLKMCLCYSGSRALSSSMVYAFAAMPRTHSVDAFRLFGARLSGLIGEMDFLLLLLESWRFSYSQSLGHIGARASDSAVCLLPLPCACVYAHVACEQTASHSIAADPKAFPEQRHIGTVFFFVWQNPERRPKVPSPNAASAQIPTGISLLALRHRRSPR